MIFPTGNSVYGQRLNGFVELEDSVTDSVIEEVLELEEVEDVEIRTQGKIIYTTITFKEGTKLAKAKEVASNTLSKYSEDVIGYYDFGYFLKENVLDVETESEDTEVKTGFTAAGTKHPDFDSISWTK